MPNLSKAEIEKLIIDLNEKTQTNWNWKYIERPQMDGTVKPSIFAKIELKGKSIADNLGFHKNSAEECQEIKQNYEQQLHALLGINPDEVIMRASRGRHDLKIIQVVIEIDDMNVIEKLARQMAMPSVQSNQSCKNELKALMEPQELTALKQDLITIFDKQEKKIEPGEWDSLNDEWEYGRGKYSGRLALASNDIHIELVENTAPKSLLILDKNNNFQPITDPLKQIEIIQGLMNDFSVGSKPAL